MWYYAMKILDDVRFLIQVDCCDLTCDECDIAFKPTIGAYSGEHLSVLEVLEVVSNVFLYCLEDLNEC